jgi:hypothetical protein
MGYREDFFKANPGITIPGKRGKQYRCVSCGGYFPKSQIDVDHRIPRRKGGTDDLWNLQPMCQHCNRSKHDNQTSTETAQTILAGTISGLATGGLEGGVVNLTRLGKSVVTQKAKDALGIKYKRK